MPVKLSQQCPDCGNLRLEPGAMYRLHPNEVMPTMCDCHNGPEADVAVRGWHPDPKRHQLLVDAIRQVAAIEDKAERFDAALRRIAALPATDQASGHWASVCAMAAFYPQAYRRE